MAFSIHKLQGHTHYLKKSPLRIQTVEKLLIADLELYVWKISHLTTEALTIIWLATYHPSDLFFGDHKLGKNKCNLMQ